MKMLISVKKDKSDKKDKQASCDSSCKFCNKKHEFGKNFVQLGGKSVNCAKLKINLNVALFAKKAKNRKHQNKNNLTNFTESNSYSSDEPLFTVTHYVNQVEKPGQSIASLTFLSDPKDISRRVWVWNVL